MFTRCPYCQQDIPQWEYQNHLVQHGPQATARQPQMALHSPPVPGMAPAQAGVVRQYYHPACGGSTAMPPQVLAQMAADPFAFGDKATCTCCGKQVPEGEMFWSDTGQSLADSRQEMKNNYVFANKLNPEDFEWTSAGPVRRKTGGGAGAGLVIGGIVAGGGVLVLLGLAMMFVFRSVGSSLPRRPAPQPGFTATPRYTPPPPTFTYTPPPTFYVPPVTTSSPPPYQPPVYTPPQPTYPKMESAQEALARVEREGAEWRRQREQERQESAKRMAEAEQRREQSRRDMERRMNERIDEMRKRTGGR